MVDATSRRSAQAMAESIFRLCEPSRLIDYGCGTGSLIAALRELGTDAVGTEFSGAARRYCRAKKLCVVPIDFRKPQRLLPLGAADVATSFEVGEHIAERYAANLIGLIARTAPLVVFSAATPGQGGHGHVNEQPHVYWEELFSREGFVRDNQATQSFRANWAKAGVETWYSANVMVLKSARQVVS
ncbi:MAG: methyltransferase domain-containing protein [Planctomycetota bacterium]